MKHRLIVFAALALAACAVVVSGNAASTGNSTLDLTGVVTGYHVALDAKPAGASPGDIGYQTGVVFEHGKRVGRFQGVCTSLPRESQQCSFTVGLHGGQIVLEAGYGPDFSTGSVALEAVVGGTGVYAGARGQGRDREIGRSKLAFHLEIVG
jgi:hypothetical protein